MNLYDTNDPNQVIKIIPLTEHVIFTFVQIPAGYKPKSLSHEFSQANYKIGYLKTFNRNPKLQPLKSKGVENILTFFTDLLKQHGWDFEKYPNPYAFMSVHKDYSKSSAPIPAK